MNIFSIGITYLFAIFFLTKGIIIENWPGLLTDFLISQGDIKDNWPRLLVGLSFSLLASQYYMNIFSSLSTKDIQQQIERVEKAGTDGKNIYSSFYAGNKWAYRCEKSFQLSSFYFGGMILICYITPLSFLMFPRLWPVLTCIACLFTVVNNYCSYKFGLAAMKIIEDQLGTSKESPSMEKFLRDIKIWFFVFLIYAVGPLVIGVLMALDWANDEKVYAFIILCNFIMLKRNCSGSKAEDIRVGLESAINGYLKSLRYVEYKNRPQSPTSNKAITVGS